jgi:hypothetical protein
VDFDLRVSFVVVTNTGEEIQFFQRRGKKSVEKFARRERFDERIFEPFLSMIFFFFFDFFLIFSSLFLGKKKTIAHLLSNTKSDTKNRHTSRRLSRTRKEEGLLTAPKRQE